MNVWGGPPFQPGDQSTIRLTGVDFTSLSAAGGSGTATNIAERSNFLTPVLNCTPSSQKYTGYKEINVHA